MQNYLKNHQKFKFAPQNGGPVQLFLHFLKDLFMGNFLCQSENFYASKDKKVIAPQKFKSCPIFFLMNFGLDISYLQNGTILRTFLQIFVKIRSAVFATAVAHILRDAGSVRGPLTRGGQIFFKLVAPTPTTSAIKFGSCICSRFPVITPQTIGGKKRKGENLGQSYMSFFGTSPKQDIIKNISLIICVSSLNETFYICCLNEYP